MSGLTTLDIVAIVWFLACAVGYSVVTRHGPLANRGLMSAIQRQRRRWMETMAVRDMRMIDTQIVDNLARGNAFFASTSVIVLGGLAALFGAAADAQALLSSIPLLQPTTEFVWQLKVVLLMAIFIFAFFKFAWAFRLSHYTAILIGATPIASGSDTATCLEHAARAARMAGLSGEHSNAGLRAYYFGLAGFGWFIHPGALIITGTWVVAVLYRREYHSRALATIARDDL